VHFDYLIIGSGIAGISAAETLRKHTSNASICVISNESHDPYSKVLLPFWLKGKIRFEQLFIRGKNFWDKNDIEFIHGEVRSIDRDARELTIASKTTISYKKLLIASGAGARKLDFASSNPPGVFYLRNLDDAIAIKEYFDTTEYRSRPQPTIYGAGFIALEFAGIFAHLGVSAKIIFRGPYFWSRLLDEDGGKLIERFLEQAGMEIHHEEAIYNVSAGLEGTPQSLFKVDTNSGSYKSNFLGLGVGLEPNLEFARTAGLKANHGIITNEYLETNDPNIFAAGDVTEFHDVIIGRHHVLGNWLNSDLQGRAAAMNMLGAEKSFELVSSYNFNFDGLRSNLDVLQSGAFNICALGDTNPAEPFNAKIFSRDRAYLKLFIKNNQCVGAVLINNPHRRQKLLELIKIKSRLLDIDRYLNL